MTAFQRPERRTLTGLYATLEPLDVATHGEELFTASSQPGAEERFRYLAQEPPVRDEFFAWLSGAAASSDPLFFAVVDRASGVCHGRQALMRSDTANGVIELGNVLWNPAIARTRVATDALYLTAAYVFDTLGYRRFEWKCDADNAPSRRAAERFGFTFEGVFRQHMIVKGRNRDTAWYSMLDSEWPALRAAYVAWLDPANFGPDGAQRSSLAEARAAAAR